MLETDRIYNLDCLDGMKMIDDDSIDLVVTSPPYDNLRLYEGYNFNFDEIANELYRIMKPGGVVVWIVGDATIHGDETGTSFKQALYFKSIGFTLHDTMIYEKNNFSFPSATRYHQIFEYMFILSKGKPNVFNPIKDKKNKYAGTKCWGVHTKRTVDGKLKVSKCDPIYEEYGMRSNIWRYVTSKLGQNDEIAYEHPAIFPESLAEDHIKSWSNEGDLILDPFMGSGTTAKMAVLNNRHYIGFEISKTYCDLIEKRLNGICKINENKELFW